MTTPPPLNLTHLRPRTTLIIIILSLCASFAQRTTRPGLKLQPMPEAETPADTATAASIALSGYEKTLKSAKESLLATNRGTDTISEIGITIDYLDSKGRQLHRRALKLTPADALEPGQTRQFEFKSWDSQRVWYYRLSEPPRAKGQATPYDVAVKVDYAIKISASAKK